MPSYQIYLPGKYGADPAHLKDVGLDLPDADKGVAFQEVFDGPDRESGGTGRGLLAFWTDPHNPEYNPLAGYHPDRQQWTPAKARGELEAGRFWMGREKGQPVEPASLLRPGWLDGTLLELGDGQEWLIPAAPMMPKKLGLDERGMPTRRVDDKYGRYWQQVIEYYELFLKYKDAFESGAKEDLHIPRAWPFAVETLQLNYRLDAQIVDWLGLLDEANIILLILRTFYGDQIRLAEALKKKNGKTESESTPPSCSAGATASLSRGAAG